MTSLAIPTRQKYGETQTGQLWHAWDTLEGGTLCRGSGIVKATPKPDRARLTCSICNGIVLRRVELRKMGVRGRRALPTGLRNRYNIATDGRWV